MPTREERDTVSQKIGWLMSMSFLREEGNAPQPASDTALPWWEDLSRAEQQAVLAEDVDWEGFTEAEKLDVERRVLEGEDMEFWMDGIEEIPTAAETRALFAEIREDTALRQMPEDQASPKTYDQQLQDAAESGRFRTPGEEGLER